MAFVALLGLEVITLESVLVVSLYQTKSIEPHIFQLFKENGLILDSEYSGIQFFFLNDIQWLRSIFLSMCYLFVLKLPLPTLSDSGRGGMVSVIPVTCQPGS